MILTQTGVPSNISQLIVVSFVFLFVQDFALDPEESRMRAAAHHMVRFMTAGMALITCREPLLISINNNLRSNFLAALRVRNNTLFKSTEVTVS